MNESTKHTPVTREGVTSGDLPPTAPVDETRRFAPDRLAFFQRIAEGNIRDREASSVARAHLVALENRIAQASQALELGHLGSARAFLEIGRRDFDAVVGALPEL